jgi:hypothetical protein
LKGRGQKDTNEERKRIELKIKIKQRYEEKKVFCAIFFLTAAKTSMLVLRVATPHGRVRRYHRFGGTGCFHLQDFQNQQVLSVA